MRPLRPGTLGWGLWLVTEGGVSGGWVQGEHLESHRGFQCPLLSLPALGNLASLSAPVKWPWFWAKITRVKACEVQQQRPTLGSLGCHTCPVRAGGHMEAVLGASLGCFHGNCSIRQNGIYVVSSVFIVLTQRSSSPLGASSRADPPGHGLTPSPWLSGPPLFEPVSSTVNGMKMLPPGWMRLEVPVC